MGLNLPLVCILFTLSRCSVDLCPRTVASYPCTTSDVMGVVVIVVLVVVVVVTMMIRDNDDNINEKEKKKKNREGRTITVTK